MRIRTIGTAALAVALVAPGCAQKSDIEAVQTTQKEILAKLEKMEKDQATLIAKVNAPAAAARPAAADPNKVYEIPVADSAVRGSKDAPVTVTMFSDFQCPFCSQAINIVDEALKGYKPTEVKFVMKQFPLRQIHPNAQPAAEAAIAAGKQGKFWEMHDELYKNNKNLTPETIKGIAEKVGLDMKKWEADRNSPEVKKQIDTELALGQTVDVRGTPSIFVNGKVLQNRSVDGMKAQIDEALKKKG